MTASIDQIRSFLLDLKYAIQDGNVILVTHRSENEETLLKLGYTPKNAIDELLGLTFMDYHKGPELDESSGKPGDVWIFGKKVQEVEVYIKIRLVSTKKYTTGVCISFHEAHYKMVYPYRP